MGHARPRPLLFAIAVGALLACAWLLAQGGEENDEQAPHPRPSLVHRGEAAERSDLIAEEDLPSGSRWRLWPASARRAAALSARRFLAAFLRYEVGDLGAAVARRLRATATPELAATLLGSPPRRVGGAMPPRGRLSSLVVALPSTATPRARASGQLHRGKRVEPFTLELIRRDRRWLAAGVIE